MMVEKKHKNDNKPIGLFENWITIKEFCEASRGNYTVLTVHRWIRQGMPIAEKIGGKIWLDPAAVRDWHQRRK